MVGWIILVTNLHLGSNDISSTLWAKQATPTIFDSVESCELFLLKEMKQSKLKFELYYDNDGQVHVKSQLFKKEGIRMHNCVLIESISSQSSNIFRKR